MPPVSYESAVDALHSSFSQDGIISLSAFERNGEVVEFFPSKLVFEGGLWAHRNGTIVVMPPPESCQVCSSIGDERLQEHDSAPDSDVDCEVDRYLRSQGIPIEDATFLAPFAETHSVVECSECSGEGILDCRGCGGSGEDPCRRCDGTGQVEKQKRCPICATGNRDCDHCEGEGEVFVIQECWSCYGSGTEHCATCRGSGETECGVCEGDGEVHQYEARKRVLELGWSVEGLPEFWGHSNGSVVSDTLAALELGDEMFVVKWQDDAFADITTEAVDVGVLKLAYGAEEYHAMVVDKSPEQRVIFSPRTGPINTSIRRKLSDLQRRLLSWD